MATPRLSDSLFHIYQKMGEDRAWYETWSFVAALLMSHDVLPVIDKHIFQSLQKGSSAFPDMDSHA